MGFTIHSADEFGGDSCYQVLRGPGSLDVWITEPEDRNFHRDLFPLVQLIACQHQALAQQAQGLESAHELNRIAAVALSEKEQEVERLKMREVELGELKLRLNCPMLAPSCMVCGKVKPFVIRHLEAHAIGVCEDCRSASQQLAASQARERELEADRSIKMNGARKLAYYVQAHASKKKARHNHDVAEILNTANGFLASDVPSTTPWLVQMMEVARRDVDELPQLLFRANETIAALQARLTASEAKRKWTKARPTVPGFYWFRKDGKKRVVELEFERDGETLAAEGWILIANYWNGSWQGPLTPG